VGIPTMTVHASFHCVSVIAGTALYQLWPWIITLCYFIQYRIIGLISRNLNFADSCLQSFRWIYLRFHLPYRKSSPNCHTYSVFHGVRMRIRRTTTPTNWFDRCSFDRASRNQRLGDGDGYNHVRNGGYIWSVAITYTQLCGSIRSF